MRDIFKTDCVAIVNPVNCKGVMGAGLAKIFKEKYPEVFEKYYKACHAENPDLRLKIGTCLTCVAHDGKIIINFPTKDDWKDKSKMEYIEKGLDALIRHIKKYDLKSVAIPALGSGLGGLNWKDVKVLINEKLTDLKLNNGTSVKIDIFEPIERKYNRKPIER